MQWNMPVRFDVQHALPFCHGHFDEGLVFRDAGIGDQQFDRSERLARFGDSRSHLIAVRHIDGEGTRVEAPRIELVRGCPHLIPIAAHHRHPVPLGGKPLRNTQADAGSSARHDCHSSHIESFYIIQSNVKSETSQVNPRWSARWDSAPALFHGQAGSLAPINRQARDLPAAASSSGSPQPVTVGTSDGTTFPTVAAFRSSGPGRYTSKF
jgi:hypothetical protein